MSGPEPAWPVAPRELAVNGEVVVISASLNLPPERLNQLFRSLSQDEVSRAMRFHQERDRGRFIAGRGQLREILGRILGVDGSEIVFGYGEKGKPHVSLPEAGRSLRFNVAHSGAVALYAFDRQGELGVDIEEVRPVPEADDIATRLFSPRELDAWRQGAAATRMQGFFHIWTRKEAYVKASGEGLSDCMDAIETGAPVADDKSPGRLVDGWVFRSLAPAPAYIGAVASKPRAGEILCWTWR